MLRFRRNHEQVPHEAADVEDNDTLVPEVQFPVNFLGSMLVPTSNGHGSARTSTAVATLYSEKYKMFSFNAKKYRLQINNDCLLLFDCSGKDNRQVETFFMKDITFCSTDKKHERAFVFVSQEKRDNPYRAFVFHCESVAKAREIFERVSSTSRVHRNLIEIARMKSLSEDGDITRLGRTCSASDDSLDRYDSEDREMDMSQNDGFRRRCQSELPSRGNKISNMQGDFRRTKSQIHSDVWFDDTIDTNSNSETRVIEEEDDDEFTALASNRTKSHQYTGLPHHLAKTIDRPQETMSLMNNPIEEGKPVFGALNSLIPFGKTQEKSTPESENLLQF